MKRLYKHPLLMFILGGLFFSTFTAYATYAILSSGVSYQPKDSSWNVDNVEDALDELYDSLKNGAGSCSLLYDMEWVYGYTGGFQEFIALAPGNYKVELWGATGSNKGYGAYTSGIIDLDADEKLYIYVGKKYEGTGNSTVFNAGTGTSGGYNGGGATDVRYFATEPDLTTLNWNNATGLNSRIMVAAGGGCGNNPGPAGGLTGYKGGGTYGGTQVSYGSVQSSGYTASSFGIANGGCSGGNGYYPGGGATCANGSGGGSSYISGHTGCVAIKEGSTTATRAVNKTGCTTGTTDNECSIHYSGKVFNETVMLDGKGCKWTNAVTTECSAFELPDKSTSAGNSGNGYAKVTYLG